MNEYLGQNALTTRYSYDRLKQITEVEDAKGNLTTVSYDGLGRRTAIKNPDTGRVGYHYDPAGNLTAKVTPNLRAQGSDVAIHYDYFFTRLTDIHYPNHSENDVHYDYGTSVTAAHQMGRIKQVKHGGRAARVRRVGSVAKLTKDDARGEDAWVANREPCSQQTDHLYFETIKVAM